MSPSHFNILELKVSEFTSRMVSFDWLYAESNKGCYAICDLYIFEYIVSKSCSFDTSYVNYAASSNLDCGNRSYNIYSAHKNILDCSC